MSVYLLKRRIERHKQAAEAARANGNEHGYREQRKAMLLAQAELYGRRCDD